MAVSDDDVLWGFRFLIGREPSRSEIDIHKATYTSSEQLRTDLMRTSEARRLFARAKPGLGGYMLPAFLLRPPEQPDVPYRFSAPTIAAPVSQMCTAEQMEGADYQKLCADVGLDPEDKHRKYWEYAYIYASLEATGCLVAGARGVGFGTGREPLPSAFARRGVAVTATDAPPDLAGTAQWGQAAQWTSELDDLWKPHLVSRSVFHDLVHYRPADMNAIPADLRGFDFCWSSCCLEHLGSLRHGLDFVRNSLDTLRPGGVAVHTTEFNLTSNETTMESPGLSLYRKRDIERLAHELVQAGHDVSPLDFWPGSTALDEHIDLPPYSSPHLKLELQGYVTTSFGIIVRKAA